MRGPVYQTLTARCVVRHPWWRTLALAGGACAAGLFGILIPSGSGVAGAASTKVPLVVYSAQGYDAAEAKAFEAASGITVQLDTNPAGALLTHIKATARHPKWGLLWIDGPTAFAGLDDQHLLRRGFEPDVSWNALGKEALPRDKSYVPTGVTLAEALVYTSKAVSDPPSSWSQLLDPQWKGAVGMQNPSKSVSTYFFVAGVMSHLGKDGVDKGKSYFKRLKANGLVVKTTNVTTLQALATGKIKLALVQSSAAVGAEHTNPTLRVEYLPPVTLLASAIGIDAKASKIEQAEAKQFIEYVLSAPGQQVMRGATPSSASLYYPVLRQVKPLGALPPLTSVKAQNITPYRWEQRESSLNTWFATHII
jgi:iron(III) transport system substrate-binding protein